MGAEGDKGELHCWEMLLMSALESAPMLMASFCRHLGHRLDGRPFMYPVDVQLLNQHRGSSKLGKDCKTRSAPGYEASCVEASTPSGLAGGGA